MFGNDHLHNQVDDGYVNEKIRIFESIERIAELIIEMMTTNQHLSYSRLASNQWNHRRA